MRVAALLLAAGILGCAEPAPESVPFADTSVPSSLVRDLRQVLARRAPVLACGPDRPFTSDRALLVLSARDCMSCRSAGFLLRQLGSRTEFDVLTADQDAQEVCVFLQKEKAEGAVFRFKDVRFRNVALADRFLLFRRAGGGGLADAVLDSDAGRLLAQWDSIVQADPIP